MRKFENTLYKNYSRFRASTYKILIILSQYWGNINICWQELLLRYNWVFVRQISIVYSA